jgi:hypothetical protein
MKTIKLAVIALALAPMTFACAGASEESPVADGQEDLSAARQDALDVKAFGPMVESRKDSFSSTTLKLFLNQKTLTAVVSEAKHPRVVFTTRADAPIEYTALAAPQDAAGHGFGQIELTLANSAGGALHIVAWADNTPDGKVMYGGSTDNGSNTGVNLRGHTNARVNVSASAPVGPFAALRYLSPLTNAMLMKPVPWGPNDFLDAKAVNAPAPLFNQIYFTLRTDMRVTATTFSRAIFTQPDVACGAPVQIVDDATKALRPSADVAKELKAVSAACKEFPVLPLPEHI